MKNHILRIFAYKKCSGFWNKGTSYQLVFALTMSLVTDVDVRILLLFLYIAVCVRA